MALAQHDYVRYRTRITKREDGYIWLNETWASTRTRGWRATTTSHLIARASDNAVGWLAKDFAIRNTHAAGVSLRFCREFRSQATLRDEATALKNVMLHERRFGFGHALVFETASKQSGVPCVGLSNQQDNSCADTSHQDRADDTRDPNPPK